MKKTLAFLSVALIGSTAAAGIFDNTVAIDFGSDMETVSWTSLGSAQALVPDQGADTGVTIAAIGGFQTASGFYHWQNPYSVQVASSNTYTDLHAVSVVFYLTFDDTKTFDDFSISLSYTLDGNAFSGVVPAYGQLIAGSGPVSSPGGDTTYDYFTYAWDLSSVQGSIADLKITFDVPTHTSITAAEVNFGSEYNSPIAVPEPSTYALIAGAFGLAAVVVARRRRA